MDLFPGQWPVWGRKQDAGAGISSDREGQDKVAAEWHGQWHQVLREAEVEQPECYHEAGQCAIELQIGPRVLANHVWMTMAQEGICMTPRTITATQGPQPSAHKWASTSVPARCAWWFLEPGSISMTPSWGPTSVTTPICLLKWTTYKASTRAEVFDLGLNIYNPNYCPQSLLANKVSAGYCPSPGKAPVSPLPHHSLISSFSVALSYFSHVRFCEGQIEMCVWWGFLPSHIQVANFSAGFGVGAGETCAGKKTGPRWVLVASVHLPFSLPFSLWFLYAQKFQVVLTQWKYIFLGGGEGRGGWWEETPLGESQNTVPDILGIVRERISSGPSQGPNRETEAQAGQLSSEWLR